MSEGPRLEFALQGEIDYSRASLFFVGNATVILRCCGFTILTDPNFVHGHEKVSLGYGLHAERLTDPAIEIRELPPIDFVLLSHFHGDHFDQVAERELPHALPILTTPAAAEELAKRNFIKASGLSTWSTAMLTKGTATLEVTAVPGWHGPGPLGAVLPEVMGSILHFKGASGETRLTMYISGDTLLIDELEEIPRRFGDMDLALLHLGGTRALGIMVTMDGEQGRRLIEIVRPQIAVPIHFDDYDLFKSPLADFQDEVTRAGLSNSVHYLARGETLNLDLPVAGPYPPSAQRGSGAIYTSDSATGSRVSHQEMEQRRAS